MDQRELEKRRQSAASSPSDANDARQAWERPSLRRLGADPAIFGGTANYYVYTS